MMHEYEQPEGPTAELIDAYAKLGHLGRFIQAFEDGHCAYHCMCLMEDDIVGWAHTNRWCAAPEGWLMVVGFAQPCVDLVDDEERTVLTIEQVPEYVGWGKVQSWLVHEPDDTVVVIEPGVRLHLYELEDFERCFQPQAMFSAHFADDSAIRMNAAFRRLAREAEEGIAELEEVL